MCTLGKWIYNKYIKKTLFVDCGKCPACQQKKAEHRTARIKNNCAYDQVCLFVNLDYSPDCVPYVRFKDIENKEDNLSVYRYSKRRRVMVNGKLELHKYDELQLLDTYDFSMCSDAYYNIDKSKFSFLRNHPEPECVGVIYFPDIQNFIKNLRQYLSRHFNFTDNFTFFICGEYGPNTMRPHWHLLIWCPVGFEGFFKDSICYAWRFNDNDRVRQHIKIGWNIAKYVSSYVNCSSVIPPFLSSYYFRQKHSYSKGFGLARLDFNPIQIEEKVARRNLTYDRVVIVDGTPRTINSVLPRYVVNRFFPKFKGYSRLTDSEIYDVICCPRKLHSLRSRCDYSYDEIRTITVSLNNAFKRYKCYMRDILSDSNQQSMIGFSRQEYAFRFLRTWSVYNSNVYTKFLENFDYFDPVAVLESYDNIVDVYSGDIDSPTLTQYIEKLDASQLKFDPNTFQSRLVSSRRLMDDYFYYQKKREVNDFVYNTI